MGFSIFTSHFLPALKYKYLAIKQIPTSLDHHYALLVQALLALENLTLNLMLSTKFNAKFKILNKGPQRLPRGGGVSRFGSGYLGNFAGVLSVLFRDASVLRK